MFSFQKVKHADTKSFDIEITSHLFLFSVKIGKWLKMLPVRKVVPYGNRPAATREEVISDEPSILAALAHTL